MTTESRIFIARNDGSRIQEYASWEKADRAVEHDRECVVEAHDLGGGVTRIEQTQWFSDRGRFALEFTDLAIEDAIAIFVAASMRAVEKIVGN